MQSRRPNGIVPYFAMRGQAVAACEFYVRAFEGDVVATVPQPDGSLGLMHAEVLINGGTVCMTDHMEGASAVSMDFGHLQLEVDDGRKWWERAIAEGCSVIAPYERQFWGDDWGLLQDPFGIRWAVLQSGSTQ
jgi:PhnB protein